MGLGITRAEHCLSFDIEEHFQVSAFESTVSRRHWVQHESRVERNTDRILQKLATRQCRATFFILGWVAERFPYLVRQIAEAGHEIASHGYSHELITSQSRTAFREDIRKAKRITEDILCRPVHGYRAPSFSVTKGSLWALTIIKEEGYLYDSSIFPVIHDRYGIPSAKPHPHLIQTDSGGLWEVPPSTASLLGIRMPIAGGGYFRLYPYFVTRSLLKKVEEEGQPIVMYLHPWEFDPDQPRMDGPMLSRFRHYLNLSRTESRFNSLLDDFAFGPIREVIPQLREICGQHTLSPCR
jgi:polysaccharide deacetylase family protein (PEP-CTERM system associated)